MERVRASLIEAVSLLFPVACPVCGAAGEPLCGACGRELAPAPAARTLSSGLVVHSALRFERGPAAVLRELKRGRTDLARALAPAMGAALAAAVRDAERAAFVPVPTSRRSMRSRGYRVPELLARRAGAPTVRLLRPAFAAGDQRGLGREERLRNAAGAMRATRAAYPEDAPVVVVDDVVTTGATCDEAARALRTAGFEVLGAAVAAATPRRADRGPASTTEWPHTIDSETGAEPRNAGLSAAGEHAGNTVGSASDRRANAGLCFVERDARSPE